MKLLCLALLAFTGCAVTTIRVETFGDDGKPRTKLAYSSGKNIEASYTNGTWHVRADAATVIDSQTKAIAVVAEAVARGATK